MMASSAALLFFPPISPRIWHASSRVVRSEDFKSGKTADSPIGPIFCNAWLAGNRVFGLSINRTNTVATSAFPPVAPRAWIIVLRWFDWVVLSSYSSVGMFYAVAQYWAARTAAIRIVSSPLFRNLFKSAATSFRSGFAALSLAVANVDKALRTSVAFDDVSL